MTVHQGTQQTGKYFEERVDPLTGDRYIATSRFGAALKDDPILNKGTCFTLDERRLFGLGGILPPAVSTTCEQEARAYENYRKASDDVSQYLFLAALQDRNETLFYRLVLDHLDEMVPIIYTPTVGKVCERYSHIYRRPRGLYISTNDRGRIADILKGLDCDPPHIIVATDNEAILGLGDQGVGGIGIAIGKVSLYTAAAGIHPARGMAISLDVGTDNPRLLEDPLYLGVRHPRLRGGEYFSLLDEFVDAVARVFPGALVQWEDFANERAFEVLHRYRQTVPSFDDDIQGTGAVVEAGIRTGLVRAGRRLQDERIVFYGAGASGAGCALQMRNALRAAGVHQAELSRRVLSLDSKGLILQDRSGLSGHKAEIAAESSLVIGWTGEGGRVFRLGDVVREFKPTVLVGVAGQPGSFTEAIVRQLAAGCERPIVLALSNPTSKVEAQPADLLRWTNGKAIIGTGSPFAPVAFDGVTHEIGQCNNVLVFPGVGLGAVVVNARWIPDVAFAAAARAVHETMETSASPGTAIFPPLPRLRSVSRLVAVAVARALVDAGAAPFVSPDEITRRVDASMWEPVYRRYRRA